MNCLKAAIEAGCDAVYLGGYSFGARNFAGNFSNEEIIEAIKYAHIYGVKIYVTVNTLIYEEEIEELMTYIDFLHKNNVDAVILQDLGMMDLIRKTYPNLEIHASTQMHIHNLEGVKFAEEMGIKRVVLARETSYQLLSEIRSKTNIELEIFVHGALCMSYSGECLMSSLLTNRSGNRGTCSQLCRMKYDLISNNNKINKDEYLLSTKDLNTIKSIGKLIDIGIDSFKIEGRMKRPEYVYLITSLYRKAIDNYIDHKNTEITDEDILEMKKIFNRQFTEGFLFNEKNNLFTNEFRPNHMGIEIGKIININKDKIQIELKDILRQEDGIRIISNEDVGFIANKIYKNDKLTNIGLPNDIIEIDNNYQVNVGDIVLKTSDSKQLKEINNKISLRQRKVNIDAYLECYVNKPLKLTFNDGKNNVEVYLNVVEKANKINMDDDVIAKQISKLGDTVYKIENLEIKKDENIFVKVSDLNEIRRNAVIELNNLRNYNIKYEKKEYEINLEEYKEEKGYSYLVNGIDDYNLIKTKNYKYLYTENKELLKIDSSIIYKLPRVIEKDIPKGNYLCSEIGNTCLNKSYSDFSLNVTNSYSVAFLNSMKVKRVTLSYELTFEQTKKLIENYKKRYNQNPNLEMIISSYPEIMISKYKLLSKYNLLEGYIQDSYKRKFKIIEKDNFMHIKNYKKIEYDPDTYFDLGINTLRIE